MDSIHCSNKQLQNVPVFQHGPRNPGPLDELEIYLDHNQLTVIAAFAFSGLPPQWSSPLYTGNRTLKITINLNDNKITQIDRTAFKGIQTTVTKINLQKNLSTHLPQALSTLDTIQELNVQGNPLTRLDGIVMGSFDQTLSSLSFSADHFAVFPTELSLLQNLTVLTVSELPFQSIAQGLGPHLSNLNINHSNLTHIPDAVCNMNNWTHLSITFSPNINSNNSLFNHCLHYVDSVSTLSLSNNQLASVPDISAWFPHVTCLNLSRNNLQNLSLGYFSIKNLPDLDLSQNLFINIPRALRNNTKLRLEYLNMANNNMSSIYEPDLQSLHSLKILELNNNPINYISPNAFKDIPWLEKIGLKNTKWFKIPTAVMKIQQQLYVVDFTGSPINCSCSNMSHIRPCSISLLSFEGTCHGLRGLPIQRYLTYHFPVVCP